MLDSQKRWDRELSDDDQQAIAFARVSLHKPPWLIIDEVLDSIDDTTYERVADILARDLEQTGVIHIERSEPHDPMFKRVLHLVKDTDAGGEQGENGNERKPAAARLGNQTS